MYYGAISLHFSISKGSENTYCFVLEIEKMFTYTKIIYLK